MDHGNRKLSSLFSIGVYMLMLREDLQAAFHGYEHCNGRAMDLWEKVSNNSRSLTTSSLADPQHAYS